MEEARKVLPEITICEDSYDAADGADVLVIVTEWNQFRMLDLERIKQKLSQPKLVDMRNVYEPDAIRRAGFEYWGIGH
jgi:UDPglucose 6-dehydrogenase